MLGKLQELKLGRFFECYDTDGDGFITEAEFLGASVRLAELSGRAGSPEFLAEREADRLWWASFRQGANAASEDRLSRAEWLAFWSAASDALAEAWAAGELTGGVIQQIKDSVMATVRLIDTDGDGAITTEELGRWQASFHCQSDIQAVFARVDQDGDGRISLADCQYLMLDFFFSNNPEAPGNYMLGPLPRR